MVENGWRILEDSDIDVLLPGNVMVSQSYVQHPDFPQRAKQTMVQVTQAEWDQMQIEAEATRQASKSPMLKSVENIYVSFLTNEWTTALRAKGLISPTTTITVANTDSTANITYLMQLRQLDTADNKPTYNYFAGEFDRIKNTILQLGGRMDDIIYHFF